MGRLRFTFIAAAAFVVIAALTHYSVAQQPGGRGAAQPGPGGFGGFGGGRGGFGGFGGFNSLLGLASNPVIQTELKADAEQKAEIKSLNEKVDQKNRDLRTKMGFGGPGGPGGPGGGQAMPDGTRPEPGGWNRISLEVTGLPGIIEELRKSGVRFRNDLVTGVGGNQVLLDDPSGNPV